MAQLTPREIIWCLITVHPAVAGTRRGSGYHTDALGYVTSLTNTPKCSQILRIGRETQVFEPFLTLARKKQKISFNLKNFG